MEVVQVKPAFLYPEYPPTVQSLDNAAGVIKITTLSGTAPNPPVVGTLATLVFQAKRDGQTQVRIDYMPGSSTDSNVADSLTSTDILGTALPVTIRIAGTSASPIDPHQNTMPFLLIKFTNFNLHSLSMLGFDYVEYDLCLT